MSSMSIGSTGSTFGAQAAGMSRMPAPPGPPPDGGALKVAAGALGMDQEDVLSALQSGKSLDDLASEQGVSHDDLVTALVAGMPPELKNSDQATQIAEKIAGTKGVEGVQPSAGPGGAGGIQGGGPGPRPLGPPPGEATGVLGGSLTGDQAKTVDALASLLGTDSSSLLDQLRSGTSLADLVSGSSVTSSALAQVLQDGLLFDQKV